MVSLPYGPPAGWAIRRAVLVRSDDIHRKICPPGPTRLTVLPHASARERDAERLERVADPGTRRFTDERRDRHLSDPRRAARQRVDRLRRRPVPGAAYVAPDRGRSTGRLRRRVAAATVDVRPRRAAPRRRPPERRRRGRPGGQRRP